MHKNASGGKSESDGAFFLPWIDSTTEAEVSNILTIPCDMDTYIQALRLEKGLRGYWFLMASSFLWSERRRRTYC